MIPLCSRSDSWTFTPEPHAIRMESNFSRCPVEIDQSKLQRAEADLRMAELTLTNKRGLHAKKIISETETLQAEASRDIAAANVVEARLTVQLSESVLKNMRAPRKIPLAKSPRI